MMVVVHWLLPSWAGELHFPVSHWSLALGDLSASETADWHARGQACLTDGALVVCKCGAPDSVLFLCHTVPFFKKAPSTVLDETISVLLEFVRAFPLDSLCQLADGAVTTSEESSFDYL